MSRKIIISILLLSSIPVFTQVATNDQLDQMTQELEGCMNEGFEDLDTARSGKIDKDYDTICDQTPIKAMPKWQQLVNTIGGKIVVHTVLLKRNIVALFLALKKNMSNWLYNRSKATELSLKKG